MKVAMRDGSGSRQYKFLVEGSLVVNWQFGTMEPRHVAQLRDEKAAIPEAANSIVKALRAVFGCACSKEYGLAARNPAKEVGYLEPNNPDGHRTWTEAEVANYEARHPLGTKARLALDMLMYTGVRISDLARLSRTMVRVDPDGEKLVFTEYKGRARAKKTHGLPILAPLRVSPDAYAAAGAKQHLVFLVTEFGQPYSIKGLGQWVVSQCRIAGLESGLSAHGIR